MQIAMIQNEVLPLEKLDPAYMDRGTYFGDGVYEVLRSYDGTIFALTEHLERFARSLNAVNITDININTVKRNILKAYNIAGIPDAKIYFHITRGSQLRNHLSTSDLKPNFFLTLTEAKDCTEEKTNGIAVSTHPDWRWKRCDIKSLNLLPNILARMDAEKKGSKEAILVDEQGTITEGAGSAFFLILAKEKVLVSRSLDANILPSITRQFVTQIASRAGLKFIEKGITPWQAQWADELFIAVTTKGIVPVVKFDGEKIRTGQPGTYTKRLIQEFQKEVKRLSATSKH